MVARKDGVGVWGSSVEEEGTGGGKENKEKNKDEREREKRERRGKKEKEGWKGKIAKRQKRRRVAAKRQGVGKEKGRGGIRVWRLGGLGPVWATLSRFSKLLFSSAN